MVVTCDIEFDNNSQGVFFAGQLVSGTVVLKVDKPKEVKGILLKISGQAFTFWTQRSFGINRTYFGKEDYLSSMTYLLGSELNTKSTIEPGTHSYTFTCQLPYNAPTSFEGRNGRIRYWVKVALVRPWKFDQSYTRGFTVIKTLDLNYEPPQIRMPSNSQAYKTFCCGPWKTEPLTIQVHVPQMGYVPGQLIPVTATIANNTDIEVTNVIFTLTMLVQYASEGGNAIVDTFEIAKVKGEKVLRLCTRAVKGDILVPATPPTCTQLCSIIQIIYQVEVTAKMKGLHSSQMVCLPVTIGNVPLRAFEIISQQPTSSRSFEVTEMSPAEEKIREAAAVAGESLPEMPTESVTTISSAVYQTTAPPPALSPPSYEESMATFTRNNMNFSPLYPVFNVEDPVNQFNQAGGQENGAYDNSSFER